MHLDVCNFKRAQQGSLDKHRQWKREQEVSERSHPGHVSFIRLPSLLAKQAWRMADYKVKQAWPGRAVRCLPKRGGSKWERTSQRDGERQCGVGLGRGLPWNEAPNSWWPIPSPVCRMRAAPSYALRGVFSSCHCVQATSPSAVFLLRSPEPALALLNKTFFVFLPFLPRAPCQILGRAAPHLFFTIHPLSSSDPNVSVCKHIHFSDPQRRVPSSRFVASRQTNRLRQEMGIAIHKTSFFFFLLCKQHTTNTHIEMCFLLQLV